MRIANIPIGKACICVGKAWVGFSASVQTGPPQRFKCFGMREGRPPASRRASKRCPHPARHSACPGVPPGPTGHAITNLSHHSLFLSLLKSLQSRALSLSFSLSLSPCPLLHLECRAGRERGMDRGRGREVGRERESAIVDSS